MAQLSEQLMILNQDIASFIILLCFMKYTQTTMIFDSYD